LPGRFTFNRWTWLSESDALAAPVARHADGMAARIDQGVENG
jgi:hypothetical protein